MKLYRERFYELNQKDESYNGNVLQQVEDNLRNEAIQKQLDTLTEREAEIIRLRYGFYESPKMLKEIGKIFNLSSVRICQIEGKGLRKLRHPTRARNLKPYFNQ